MIAMKKCSKCQISKPETEFSKDISRKSGLRACCKQCCKEYNYQYRQEHTEELRDYRKRYYEEHAEEAREYNQKYYQEHTEEIGKYRESHRDHRRKYDRRHYATNKAMYLDRDIRRRQRERMVEGKLTNEIITKLFTTYTECLLCKTEENLTIDHIVAITNGGTNYPDNLQILCRSCNSAKGNRHSTDYRPSGVPECRSRLSTLQE